MALPNPKSHRISLVEAAAQTKKRKNPAHKGGLFLRKEIDEMLAQAGCSGIRFYYGVDASGLDSLVLVGVDKEGNDLIDGPVIDSHFPCPPFCGLGNSLNS